MFLGPSSVLERGGVVEDFRASQLGLVLAVVVRAPHQLARLVVGHDERLRTAAIAAIGGGENGRCHVWNFGVRGRQRDGQGGLLGLSPSTGAEPSIGADWTSPACRCRPRCTCPPVPRRARQQPWRGTRA